MWGFQLSLFINIATLGPNLELKLSVPPSSFRGTYPNWSLPHLNYQSSSTCISECGTPSWACFVIRAGECPEKTGREPNRGWTSEHDQQVWWGRKWHNRVYWVPLHDGNKGKIFLVERKLWNIFETRRRRGSRKKQTTSFPAVSEPLQILKGRLWRQEIKTKNSFLISGILGVKHLHRTF